MIPRISTATQRPAWQRLLAEAITDPRELLTELDLDLALLPSMTAGARDFGLRVPRGYLTRIRRGDPHDPLLRQILPDAMEGVDHPGFIDDPVGDSRATTVPGILHKYAGRLLLVTTGACAVHCRFCFRRHFPYADNSISQGGLETALAHIAADRTIEEVILSGGDPLIMTDQRLDAIMDGIERIAHVRRVRIHTRLPVVLPERVDSGLLGTIGRRAERTVVVVHANHPNEIDGTVGDALLALRSTGAAILNQSVLLRGVNDDAGTLAELSKRLFAAGTLPYYLHLLDRVSGGAHFEVAEMEAREITGEMSALLPGYLLPRLARDVEGMASKVQIAPQEQRRPRECGLSR